MVYVSLFFLFIGLFLDLLNIVYAYLTMRDKYHHSGLLLIPLIFYVLFVVSSNIDFVENNIFLLIALFTFIHFVCYMFEGIFVFFSKYISKTTIE